MNSIKDIQKYIKDNNITSDIENEPRLIDYVDTIGIKPMSKEKAEEIFDKLKEIIKEKGCKFVVVDSLSGF